MDYSLARIGGDASSGYKVLVETGELAAPFPIVAYKDTLAVRMVWYEGFAGEQELDFPATDDRLVLDGEHLTLEVYRKNNTIKTSGVLKKMEPFQPRFTFGTIPENSRRTTLNLMPIIGGNLYDGTHAGLAIHNNFLPARRFQFQWTPLYGTGSGKLVGTANAQYNIFPKSEKIKQLSIGLRSKAFTYREARYGQELYLSDLLQYRTVVPYLRLDLMRASTASFTRPSNCGASGWKNKRYFFQETPLAPMTFP